MSQIDFSSNNSSRSISDLLGWTDVRKSKGLKGKVTTIGLAILKTLSFLVNSVVERFSNKKVAPPQHCNEIEMAAGIFYPPNAPPQAPPQIVESVTPREDEPVEPFGTFFITPGYESPLPSPSAPPLTDNYFMALDFLEEADPNGHIPSAPPEPHYLFP
ncbi:MAG: hypothetical protein ACOYK9_03955 [Chlamydiia bacterium]